MSLSIADIYFHAFLRLPKQMSSEEKKARCMRSIRKLGLQRCMNTRIGEPLKRGVSGGERKRVCIALGLLTEPRCVFLDEPTSGLDSHISLEVMQSVRKLASEGTTILCTIHQPSQAIYNMFDGLVVLDAGEVAYWGPGKAEAKAHFVRLGFRCDDYDNTAEYILDVVSGGAESSLEHARRDLPALFQKTGAYEDMEERALRTMRSYISERSRKAKEGNGVGSGMRKLRKCVPSCLDCGDADGDVDATDERVRGVPAAAAAAADPDSSAESTTRATTAAAGYQYHLGDVYANSHCRELWILVGFKARAHFKDPHFIGTRMICPLLFSLILSSFWGQPIGEYDKLSPGAALELSALLFIIVGTNAFMTTFFVPAIMDERPVFIKERHDSCYRVLSYVLHKIIIEALANVPAVILFSIPIYFATPLMKQSNEFFFFMLTLYTLNLCTAMLALAVASICPSMEIAGALVPAILSLCAIAGGFLKSTYSLPIWWRWFNVVDFVAWGYSALMMNQYRGHKWWYCLPPNEIAGFVSGGTGGDTGSGDLGGALGLLGDGNVLQAQCRYTDRPTEDVAVNLKECMLPVAVTVASNCFPSDFGVAGAMSCEELCAPVEGESIIEFYQLSWRMGRWQSLGILACQLPLFFLIFYGATRFIRHEER